MQLPGKVAIVTGSGNGIGRAIAARFAQEGASVVVSDIDEEGIAETLRLIAAAGGQALPVIADVGRSADAERMVRKAVGVFGRLDILVNNAGIPGNGPVEEEVFDRVVDCNLRGMWMGCHFAAPEMKKAGAGVILTIFSVQVLLGWKNAAIYGATKAGVLGATRALAVELADSFIRVNAICPGAIHARSIEERVAQHLGPEYVAEFQQCFGARLQEGRPFSQPLPRTGLPEDIAHCALILASDEASFITGAYVVVDDGLTVGHSLWKEIQAWREDVKKRKRGT